MKVVQKSQKMKNKTFKISIFLICLLFINIEAAQAGLIQKFKIQVLNDFSEYQLFYLIGSTVVFIFFIYVVFTPISIGKDKFIWYKLDTFALNRHNYQSKRIVIKKISTILNKS